jgi:GDP-fucose protein O-fucosyltransferase
MKNRNCFLSYNMKSHFVKILSTIIVFTLVFILYLPWKYRYKPKYLILPIGGGFSNQIISLSVASQIARRLNRILVIPPLTSSHIDRGYYRKLDKLPTGHIMIDANISGLYEVYGHSLLSGILEVKSNIEYITLDKHTNNNIERWKCWHWNSDEDSHLEYLLEKHQEDLSQETLCIGNAFTINGDFLRNPNEWLGYSEEIKIIAHEWLQLNNISDFIAIHFRGTDFAEYLGKDFVSFERVVPIVQNILSKSKTKDVVIITDERNTTIINTIDNLGWKRFNTIIEKENEYKSELYTLVTEQYIASLSKIFIGCNRSTFSRTITEFKQCEYDNKICYDYISVANS